MARLQWYLDPLSPHQLKKQTKKQRCLSWTPLTKLSGSAHEYLPSLAIQDG